MLPPLVFVQMIIATTHNARIIYWPNSVVILNITNDIPCHSLLMYLYECWAHNTIGVILSDSRDAEYWAECNSFPLQTETSFSAVWIFPLKSNFTHTRYFSSSSVFKSSDLGDRGFHSTNRHSVIYDSWALIVETKSSRKYKIDNNDGLRNKVFLLYVFFLLNEAVTFNLYQSK